MPVIRTDHDLSLPAWGPYSKKYQGVSHIADQSRGLRFDVSIFPGLYRRSVNIPAARWESGCHPWTASPELSYFAYRQEVEWKDRVYVDTSFSRLGDDAVIFACDCVNHTELDQNLTLHLMAYLAFPSVRAYSEEPLRPAEPFLPDGAVWVDAMDYVDLTFAEGRPTDTLVPDAMLRGEVRASGFVGGRALGRRFGATGDRAAYRLHLPEAVADCTLVVRYRNSGGTPATLQLGGAAHGDVELPPTENVSEAQVAVGNLPAGEHRFELTGTGSGTPELDGFLFAPAETIGQASFTTVDWNPQPELISGPSADSLLLRYRHVDQLYGIQWHYEPFEVRQFLCADLDIYMRHRIHDHVRSVLAGPGDGHYTNVFLRPIRLAPGSTRRITGVLCTGSQEAVERQLAEAAKDEAALLAHHESQRAKTVALTPTHAGRRFERSQERMAATTLTNLVFPVYARRRYIKHNTPGRWWDSLYTWDSGFIALGLLQLSERRAAECISAYLTDPDDPHAAFIHHGSPVPVQILVMQEYWNQTHDLEVLRHWYPRLRQYHRFLCGRFGSSTTRTLASGLLRTWDYFYNSGGWDDYPPQVHVHRNALRETVTPVANSAMAIRTAKLLREAAVRTGNEGDVPEYERDVTELSEALQTHAWDEDSGYFGYVVHGPDGRPAEILRHETGANFDMGLDGVYPLVASVCTPEQERRFADYLQDPARLWTEIGISTVDQSAPYYRIDGYWNGAVWMPHQWILWKALLDHGHGDLAFRIAETALQVWQRETDSTYNCYEHFMVQSGRGAGWHQFSGLSSPVLHWYAAYYRTGTLTAGYDTWIDSHRFGDGDRTLEATVHSSGTAPIVIAVLDPTHAYHAAVDGTRVQARERLPGVLEIPLASGHHLRDGSSGIELSVRPSR
jgi:hypothetical protein